MILARHHNALKGILCVIDLRFGLTAGYCTWPHFKTLPKLSQLDYDSHKKTGTKWQEKVKGVSYVPHSLPVTFSFPLSIFVAIEFHPQKPSAIYLFSSLLEYRFFFIALNLLVSFRSNFQRSSVFLLTQQHSYLFTLVSQPLLVECSVEF